MSSPSRPSAPPAAHRWYPAFHTDYELLDSGNGARLERFGSVVLERPDGGAVWPAALPLREWERADARFEPTGISKGHWLPAPGRSLPDVWTLAYRHGRLDLRFQLELTSFKHVGLFPEQAANWDYLAETLAPGDRFLNLFAYTGGASLAARAAGADVTHVDAIRQVVDWTRVNMELSGLDGIRWVVEDASRFVARELRRGNRYRAIALDPPTWGIGPQGAKWKLEDHLIPLLEDVLALLEPQGVLILNTYSGLSPTTLETLARRLAPGKTAASGELCLLGKDGHLLPTGSLLRLT
jgi:23S rRNA (cytosine1962-C5)-methyltransferase